MGISEWGTLILDQGLAYAIITMLCVAMWKIWIVLLKLFTAWAESIIARIWWPKKGHYNPKIQAEINDILLEILRSTDVDSARVLQYHNWVTYKSWQHAFKITCTNWFKKDATIPSDWLEIQSVPVWFFETANSPFYNWKNIIKIPKIDMEKAISDRQKQSMMTYMWLWFKSYYAFAIRDWKWNLVAKLTLIWMVKEYYLSEEIIQTVEREVEKLQILINLKG